MLSSTVSRSLLWIGVAIVIATHVYMLVAGLPASQMVGHAVLNLIAGALIVLSSWKKT